MSEMFATQDVKDDLEDLLQGLKVVRERWNNGREDEARQILEQVGHRFAQHINSLKIVRPQGR